MSADPVTTPVAFGAGRIAGLDLWRAVLMSAGVFVHGSLWLPPTPLFVAVGDASQAFRMGAFYAISGVLSALALAKRDPLQWLRQRLLQLGIPAFFALTIFSPLIWYVVTSSRASVFGWPLLPFEWHHLWFLFGLMLYSVLAVMLHNFDRRTGLIGRLDTTAGAGSGRVAILAVAALGACLLGTATPLIFATLSPGSVRSFGNVQLIFGYLPMFLLGFVLARSPRLCGHFHATRRFSVVICLGMTVAYAVSHLVGPLMPLANYVRFVAATLCPPVAFVLIFGSAMMVRRVPLPLLRLSEASYTIYILHYPICVLINVTIAIHVEPIVAYFLSVVASGAASFAFHVLAVERSSALKLLVNGKPTRRSGSFQPTSPPDGSAGEPDPADEMGQRRGSGPKSATGPV